MREVYTVRDLNFSFEDKVIFSKANFIAYEGKLTLLAGRTGSGKTTFLDLLFGILKPNSGEILYLNKRVTSSDTLVGSVSYLISEPERYFFESTVIDEVMHVVKFAREKTDQDPERIAAQALSKVGFNEEVLERDPLTLSKGEKRKLAIACILAGSSKVLLMDEPLSGLDYPGVVAVCSAIKTLIEEGYTVIAASHEIDPFLELKPDIYLLHDKKVHRVENGNTYLTKKLFTDAGLPISERFQLLEWFERKGVSVEIQNSEVDFLKSAVEALKKCI